MHFGRVTIDLLACSDDIALIRDIVYNRGQAVKMSEEDKIAALCEMIEVAAANGMQLGHALSPLLKKAGN